MQLPSCWIEDLPLEKTLSLLTSLARDHFKKGGYAAKPCLDALERRDWAFLVNFNVDYLDSSSADEIAELRQGLAFFQKLEDLEIGIDKESVARETFMRTEDRCREYNNFFREYRCGTQRFSLVPRAVTLIEGVRRKVRHILGRAPKIGSLKLGFGPGATTDIRKTSAAPVDKFASGFQCSSSMLSSGFLPQILREVPHWASEFSSASWTDLEWSDNPDDWVVDDELGKVPSEFSITDGITVPVVVKPGTLTFVPKSAKTYRTIIVEPNLCGFVQQGIRKAMELRLLQAGLPTNDQAINQRRAKQGSLDGSLATADLSSASDLICYELVKLVVPDDWFQLLVLARSGSVLDRKNIIQLEKFSSMGNAYTFPLETLLFWAIAATSLEMSGGDYPSLFESVTVFGDDIIIPTEGFATLEWALDVLGFQMNRRKSYSDGPFRESCGHDYYRGINIRPYYQKNLVCVSSLFSLHNFYYRKAHFHRAARIRKLVPESLRLYGPDGYGDGHLLSDDWGRYDSKLLKKGFRGKLFDTFTLKAVKKISRYPGDYVTPLYSIYSRGGGDISILSNNASDVVHAINTRKVDVGDVKIEFSKTGRPFWAYPGNNGYKRVSIYTLG